MTADARATTETPTEWMLRHIAAFAESNSNWNQYTAAGRLRLAQHLGGNWEMVQEARARAIPPSDASEGWMLGEIKAFYDTFPGWKQSSERDLQSLAEYLGAWWDLRHMARAAAKPPAILPDVREVIESYEERAAALKARVQALADLLQAAMDADYTAMEKMGRVLSEIREMAT